METQSFSAAYDAFLASCRASRKGEALRRLNEGHGFGERLFLEVGWFPAFGHFRNLHPEYEVLDFNGTRRFLDFAFIYGPVKLDIEVDGYKAHVKLNRWQFADQLHRQNDLVIDGWQILRFSVDDLEANPRRCQQRLQQFMGRRFEQQAPTKLAWRQHSLLRLTQRMGVVTPRMVQEHLQIGRSLCYRLLHQLVAEDWLEPVRAGKRIRFYKMKTGRIAP